MAAITYVILILIIVILLITAFFVTYAASKITKVPGYAADPDLKSAHTLLTWISVITWGSVALVLVIFIAAISSGILSGTKYSKSKGGIGSVSESAQVLYDMSLKYLRENSTTEKILIALIFLIALLALVNGILAAISCVKIANSPNYDAARSVYNYCLTAAILGIGVTLLALAGAITMIVLKSKYRKRFEASLEEFSLEHHQDPDNLKRQIAADPSIAITRADRA